MASKPKLVPHASNRGSFARRCLTRTGRSLVSIPNAAPADFPLHIVCSERAFAGAFVAHTVGMGQDDEGVDLFDPASARVWGRK